MNKLIAVVLFPIIWISLYLYRIIVFDIIGGIIDIIIAFLISPLQGLISIIPYVFATILDIPIGLFVTFLLTLEMCTNIFNGDIDIVSAVKECFTKK